MFRSACIILLVGLLFSCNKERALKTPLSNTQYESLWIEFILRIKLPATPDHIAKRYSKNEMTPMKKLDTQGEYWLMKARMSREDQSGFIDTLKKDEDIVAVELNEVLNFK